MEIRKEQIIVESIEVIKASYTDGDKYAKKISTTEQPSSVGLLYDENQNQTP